VSTVGQGGIAAAAFGLGGDAAFAGVLHLVLHTLAKSALLQGVGRAGSSRAALLLAAGLAAAGLPPAGVFASEFLVLAEATRQAPLVAAPLAAGIIVTASALMVWLRRLLLDPATAGAESAAPPAALLGAWANLALALVLALAMPGPVLALLRAAAR
jgi:hydrogenase-4 component F